MPWTPEEFKRRHNKGLSDHAARVAAYVANQVLRSTGDEGRAVREGNAAAKNVPKKKGK